MRNRTSSVSCCYKKTADCASRQTLGEIEDILDSVEGDPGTNSRKNSTKLAIRQTRVVKTLHHQGLYLYHLQRVQNLELEIYAKLLLMNK